MVSQRLSALSKQQKYLLKNVSPYLSVHRLLDKCLGCWIFHAFYFHYFRPCVLIICFGCAHQDDGYEQAIFMPAERSEDMAQLNLGVQFLRLGVWDDASSVSPLHSPVLERTDKMYRRPSCGVRCLHHTHY